MNLSKLKQKAYLKVTHSESKLSKKTQNCIFIRKKYSVSYKSCNIFRLKVDLHSFASAVNQSKISPNNKSVVLLPESSLEPLPPPKKKPHKKQQQTNNTN